VRDPEVIVRTPVRPDNYPGRHRRTSASPAIAAVGPPASRHPSPPPAPEPITV